MRISLNHEHQNYYSGSMYVWFDPDMAIELDEGLVIDGDVADAGVRKRLLACSDVGVAATVFTLLSVSFYRLRV